MRFIDCATIVGVSYFAATALRGQDTRTVTEPSFPPVCTHLKAQLLKTGPSGLDIAVETMADTGRIQSALDLCPSGQAVALRRGRVNDAFLIAPIRIPPGVTLLVGAGVTVFASRNPRDYDANAGKACGTIAATSSGCLPLITANRSDDAGIMGNGIIDGRGELPLLIDGVPLKASWWDLANQANVEKLSQNCPRMLQVSNTNNFTLYRITLMNSPNFHVALGNDTNFTAWGIKIIAPYDARNTDGLDPGYSSNVTITNSYISDGDDNVAVGGNNLPGARNISVTNNHFGDGHGASIGSFTQAGVSDVLFDRISFAGDRTNGNQTGIRIKSDVSRGGLVQNVTYRNICMQNVRHAIVFDPFYTAAATGNLIPQFSNIKLQNVHATTEGSVKMQGHDADAPLTLTLNNVQIDGIKSSDITQQYATYTLGPDPVNFASMLIGSSVSVNNNVSNSNPPLDCPDSLFAPIAGELLPAKRSRSGAQSPAVRAKVFTTKAVPYQTYLSNLARDPNATLALTAPTGSITVYEGETALATAQLDGSQIVTVPLPELSMGTHALRATYSGDANYPGFAFGNYTLTVP